VLDRVLESVEDEERTDVELPATTRVDDETCPDTIVRNPLHRSRA